MKRIKPIYTILLIILIHVASACVKDQDFSTPIVHCEEPDLKATNTLQQIKEMYSFGAPKAIDTDVVIEGYVVSSDISGNIYKTISIQDKPENPTEALKISIDQTDLYTTYNVGRKVFVKLNGLAVGYRFGSIQVGKAEGLELGRIPKQEVKNHIIRSCEIAEIIPKPVNISEIHEGLLDMLIEVEQVQFKSHELGNSYGNIDNSATVDRLLEGFDSHCSFQGNLILRNSGFSDFKDHLLPEGNGSIKGVLSNYYNDLQLYIRDIQDVNLVDARCDQAEVLQPNLLLSELRALYTNTRVELGIADEYVVEGFVISSDEEGNFQNELVIQDAFENPTAGIRLLLDKEAVFEEFNVGDQVILKLNKLYLDRQDGILTLGYAKGTGLTEIESTAIGDHVFKGGLHYEMIPTEITMDNFSNPIYESTLVNVNNVQLVENERGKSFTYFSGSNDGIRTLETCSIDTKLAVFTHKEATFANKPFPEGRGSITGVFNASLKLRDEDDILFTEDYEVCPVIVPKVMITEVADPKNSIASRFVELYNAGETAINLSGWKLNKYINGSSAVSGNSIDFQGITIPAGEFLIIANTGYAGIFNLVPTITSTYISCNGDDVFELVDATGTSIDVFGVIGEDGNGTNWEYLDGKALRNISVTSPNPIFTIVEWTIYSAATNNLITHPDSPQNAPGDFGPGER